jgi:hypothetical protein
MSKLYVEARSDAIKTTKTARGHREACTNILYNFTGGNTPAGKVSVDVIHNGSKIRVEVQHHHEGGVIRQDSYVVDENGAIEN